MQVPARKVYYTPARPLVEPATRAGDELRLEDVTWRRHIKTTQLGRLTIPKENSAAALEVMSRFALHPRKLPYLPPTMSPVPSSKRPGYLEHPDEAFAEYAKGGTDVADLLERTRQKLENIDAYTKSWRRYVWPTNALEGVQCAPFQVLAAEGATFEQQDHLWHLELADSLVAADTELFRTTKHLVVDTSSESSRAEGVRW